MDQVPLTESELPEKRLVLSILFNEQKGTFEGKVTNHYGARTVLRVTLNADDVQTWPALASGLTHSESKRRLFKSARIKLTSMVTNLLTAMHPQNDAPETQQDNASTSNILARKQPFRSPFASPLALNSRVGSHDRLNNS